MAGLKKCDRRPEPRWIALEREAQGRAAWIARHVAIFDVEQIQRHLAALRDCLVAARRYRPHRTRGEIEAKRDWAGLPREPGGVLVSRQCLPSSTRSLPSP